MDIPVGKRREEFASEAEVMREGLRLVEEREAKLKSLRETVETSLAEEGLEPSRVCRSGATAGAESGASRAAGVTKHSVARARGVSAFCPPP